MPFKNAFVGQTFTKKNKYQTDTDEDWEKSETDHDDVLHFVDAEIGRLDSVCDRNRSIKEEHSLGESELITQDKDSSGKETERSVDGGSAETREKPDLHAVQQVVTTKYNCHEVVRSIPTLPKKLAVSKVQPGSSTVEHSKVMTTEEPKQTIEQQVQMSDKAAVNEPNQVSITEKMLDDVLQRSENNVKDDKVENSIETHCQSNGQVMGNSESSNQKNETVKAKHEEDLANNAPKVEARDERQVLRDHESFDSDEEDNLIEKEIESPQSFESLYYGEIALSTIREEDEERYYGEIALSTIRKEAGKFIGCSGFSFLTRLGSLFRPTTKKKQGAWIRRTRPFEHPGHTLLRTDSAPVLLPPSMTPTMTGGVNGRGIESCDIVGDNVVCLDQSSSCESEVTYKEDFLDSVEIALLCGPGDYETHPAKDFFEEVEIELCGPEEPFDV